MSIENLITVYEQQGSNMTNYETHSDGHVDRHQDKDSLEYPYDHTDWHSDNHIDKGKD